MALRSRPSQFRHFYVSFPHERVLQVTLNRPEKLNCIDKATSDEIKAVWELFDQDPSFWVGIITGVGRAFCTGADLHEWDQMNEAGMVNDMAAPGLAGLPRRGGKKPIIAAVNGIAMGGGFEMVANCDLVVASSSAVFSLPEAKRGIVPVAGCLPRLTRTLGLQRTSDLVLTGRKVSGKTLHEWGLVSHLVDSGAEAVQAALEIAQDMCSNSPDALIVGRIGIRLSWEASSVEEAVSILEDEWYPRLVESPNFAEGIKAFVEKRPPRWINSKL
ncbi:enoyl-hydratase isomerase family protein [Neofusicoccum parvum]|uniref:Enoyl-hydratase isomerase family protein n=1 Tax=Neofusicoccum parvum TaxID=310453 RepID=A0ACB5SL35_9PEZI|nr:enoyl-hydratase isomerase family protein [Neofusicoccum parvum]